MIGRRAVITLLGGAAASWPLMARTQPARRAPRIGVLWHAGSAEEEGPYFTSLLQGFIDLGYVEGKTITFEHRFPNEMPDRFKSMAAELASLNVDILVSVGNVASPYAKNATKTIPVVFVIVPDPLGTKLVESFARPGGNVTGLSTYASDIIGRRLQLLKEIVPGLSRVAQLVNPNSPASRLHIELTQAAAAELQLTLQRFEARQLDELESTLDAMARAGMQAIAVNPEGLPFQGRVIIPIGTRAPFGPMCLLKRDFRARCAHVLRG
jgi:putative tryptophan/tyrosine transport system substrate-binding protein